MGQGGVGLKKVFVTGAAGFLGTHLCGELNARGFMVAGCDLVHGSRSDCVRADVGEYRQIATLIDQYQPDIVYHLAAEFGRNNGEDYYEQVWRTNAIGTKHIVRLQEKHGFRLVFFSSSEIYGDYPGKMVEQLSDEVSLRQLNDYAISKMVGEQQVMNSADRHGTETVRVRLFNTYGPGEMWTPYRSVVAHFIHCALHKKPCKVFLGYKRTSTYVTDMIRTLSNITTKFKPGAVYNIAGEQFHDVKTASDLVLRAIGANDDHIEYQSLDAHNTVNKDPDITMAQRDLGHECRVGLEQGIAETVKWARA
jgi:dTDP-glucose 4,6-dehydratase